MTVMPPTHEDEVNTLWYLGWLVRMRLDAADTGGALAIADELGRAGLATPLHRHSREDETLIVIDGEVTAWIGDEIRTASAGEAVWLPRDIPHAFRVDSETARVLNIVGPAGFEAFFREIGEPAGAPELPPGPTSPPDARQMAAAAAALGVEILGPPPS